MAMFTDDAQFSTWDGDIFLTLDEIRNYHQGLIDAGFTQKITIRHSDAGSVTFRTECTLPGDTSTAQGGIGVDEGKISGFRFEPRF